jgi:hypothetical protein
MEVRLQFRARASHYRLPKDSACRPLRAQRQIKLLNRFSTAPLPQRSSEVFMQKPSSAGRERDAYLPIGIFAIGDSVFLIWKSGCVLMYIQVAIRAA